ncbi:MAG: filamentous hemagglutinin family protein [Methylovulum sp.]|nr:filamentous hemagglutinin family protein [Methylovulum sp.]
MNFNRRARRARLGIPGGIRRARRALRKGDSGYVAVNGTRCVPYARTDNKPLPSIRLKTLVLAIRALLVMTAGVAQANPELPVPTAPVTLSNTPVAIASQGQASATVSGNAMTVTQTSDKASIDWQSFNIGADSSVRFDQPSATAVALNNIHQADPSRIMGSLSANGQVYLVNQNGFVFGQNSQINVNSLVATTLGISETTFQNGITKAFDNDGSAALQGNGELYLKDKQGNTVLDQHGNKIKIQIFIEQGAHIKTNASGGRVIIAAPVVNNAGTIETPDGQTILAAAKDTVYLQEADSGSDIRGLLVEVGTGGEVNNMGKVLAERGNASLMGFAVNQQGIASATTSVSLNGSVRLLAREGIQDPSGTGGKLLPKATVRTIDLDDGLGTEATVHLASGSLTQVALDTDKSATAIDAQAQNRSHIEISGHNVYLHKQSAVQAKSGVIDIAAIDNPTDSAEKGDARIFLESGSSIDASGVKDVQLPMERNVVNVELRKNELRDAPLQRDGVLYGQTVAVDIRDASLTHNADGTLSGATIPVADIKGAIDRIARNIDERSTSGGTVNLSSSGDVVTQSGSVIDFSGGSVAYQDGTIATTKLVAGGQIYDIASADANRHYDSILGLVTDHHAKWGVTESWTIPGLAVKHFEAGYTEGKAGGTLNIAAYETRLNGVLDGSTIAGNRQRTADARASGSTLALDLNKNSLLGKQDIVFNNNGNLTDIDFDERLPDAADGSDATDALTVDAGLFKRSGITHVSIKTNGAVSLQKDADLDLPEYGSLDLSATGFDIQGSITAASGAVSLKPVSVADTVLPSAITLGGNAVIDVSGLWVNDVLDSQQGQPLGTIASAGGTVTLLAEQGDLRLAAGSRIDVSGGAWLDTTAKVTAGQGGTISLTAATHDGGGAPSSLILDGELAGWGIAQGGSLNLSSNEVVIGAAGDAPVRTDTPSSTGSGQTTIPLILAPDFFQQGGFADYRIDSNLYGLKVADHVQLKPQQKNRVLDSTLATQASGSDLASFSSIALLPETDRKPTNLSLSFSELLAQNRQESLSIGQGAHIETDAAGTVQLDSDTSIFVDGTISTPGGNITMNINTPTSGDKGHFDAQGIWLGSKSRLLAKGVFKPELNDYGLKTGEVLSGGTIALTAKRGYIVTRAGSVINVSGTSEQLDFQQPDNSGSGLTVIPQTIASDGGAISLKAGEGIVADGMLRAKGGAGAAGGTLSVELNRGLRNKPLLPVSGGLFPDDINSGLPRTIVISAYDQALLPDTLANGSNIDANTYSGRALFNDRQINSAGFDSLLFKTDVLGADGKYAGSIRFKGDVQLAATRQIVLDTPTLQTTTGQVQLNTAYAKLGSTQSRIDNDLGDGSFSTTLAPAAKTGAGKLTVDAQGIDLVGGLSFDGFNKVKLLSLGDVRTIGIRVRTDTKDYLGALRLSGDLTIKASQLYPATLSDYTIAVDGSGDETVNILKSGGTPAPVYSAGGALTITAPNISQKGVVKAPSGALTLNASQQLILAAGSLTSVSGDGLNVLFGQGSGGLNWLYPLDSTGNTNRVIDSPPEKRLALNGKNVALRSGASIDLSGGGDLYAYEFITGPGGSVDVLDANAPGYTQKFAVLPNLGKALTPYDPQEFSSSGLSVGDSVYLSAGSGLKAGWYTLLPAHYALLPGAYLITPQSGTQDRLPGQTVTDLAGATIVAGRYGVAGTGIKDARWQGFAVESGAIARTRSQYTDYSANAFFPAKAASSGTTVPALPRDAGSLAITAQTGLTLGANLAASAAAQGLGGQVDISADHLAIVGKPEDLASNADGTVGLLADDLNNLDAPSLLLGGIRNKTSSGQRVAVSSQTLSIAGDVVLQGDEILLAAKNEVRLKSGATVASSGKNSSNGTALLVANNGQQNSDGALVRVSSSGQATVTRDKTVTGKTGTLVVESGAHLTSGHSMLLDSTQDTVFDGVIDMQGGSLALTASKISLGAAPVGTSGLVLSDTQLALDELKLTSASDFDIYGGVAVSTGLLSIDAAQINGFNNAGASASITADILQLTNTGAKAGSTGTGTGNLALNADEIQLGAGDYSINGYGQVNLNAATAIKGLGQTLDADTGLSALNDAGSLKVAGDLHLNAGHFIGDAGATTSIDASGHHVTITSALPADASWTSGLGASWAITGAAISSSGRFDLPSGILKLTALEGDIALNNGSLIDVSGRTIAFADINKSSPAGSVLLASAHGDINLAADARINLAGATQGRQQAGDAGLLSVSAKQGQFNWDGDISAQDGAVAPAALKQGKFHLDVNSFGSGGFSALNNKLAAAGFTEELTLEQRTGDITIANIDTVNTHRFQLLADQGKVTVDGTINANSSQAGSASSEVSIYGRNGITLGATGNISATAGTASADGGSVTLDTVHRDDTGSGLLDLSQTGGSIDVSGGAGGAGGSVHLRTGRDDAAHTVAITNINTRITGADANRTAVEATRVYDGQAVIKDANITAWQNDTRQFMAAAPRLTDLSGSAIELLPGIEVRSSGDLSLAKQWDFLGWRYNDAQGNKTLPGFLTLSAGGDLNINATLTDAFATGPIPGQSSVQFQDLLQTGRSWSYQLLAGVDINLANSYLAPDPYGTGGNVSTQVMVRTGTGTIDIHAEDDIRFVSNAADPSASAAVYTMGKPADYTRGQLLGGAVPGVPAKLAGESDASYLNRLDPQQMNTLLRYGYLNETLLGLVFRVAEYPTEGGAIDLQAGGNIDGINTGQETSDWLVRSGVITDNLKPTAWGINISGDRTNVVNGISAKGKHYFNQNIGALGGGDVNVEAGGDVRNLSVMLPTTGKPFGSLSDAANQWSQNGTVINGGGNLQVTAGHNIVGGEYYIGRGIGNLNAGGSVARSSNHLGALLELGDGTVNVQARQDVVIASVLNPTVLKQASVLPLAAGGDSKFFSYSDASTVNLGATAGNIVLQNDVDAIRLSKNLDTSASSGFEYAVYPGSLHAAALSGDIRINHSMTLFPSAQGELELLAYRNIGTDTDAAQLININMSDADPLLLPSIGTPAQQLEGSLSDGLIRARERLDPSTPDATLIHAAVPVHAGDASKPAVIAKLGDIAFASSSEVTFFLPQAADFIAGRDINNLSLSGQNLSVNDVTQIKAGRDIGFDALIDSDGIVQANDKQIELGGPGHAQIQAGRNISLGGSAGINTIGNTKNTALAANGANIDLLAGVVGPMDYDGFINTYFLIGSDYLNKLTITDDNGQNAVAGFTPEQKLAYLQQLPDALKQKLLLDVLFNEIKLSASAAAAAPESERKALYQQGYAAIAALFPGSGYKGDLSLVFSQIKTLAGGGINLAVPGGAVNVGLAGKVGGIQKGADELGIVAQQAGDVNAFSLGDFNVNQSRVFTMGGGDIAIWSSAGNIDAGKGAKSAISAPAPITSVDAKGNIITVFPPIVSGSGIQTINPQDKAKKQGNVYLAAPTGVVDAGEAGISGGQIVIAATAVVGASNISASGGSVGVPTAVAPPVVPAGAASAAASAAKQATSGTDDDAKDKQNNGQKKSTVSMLSADVVGYGDCSVADVREGKPGCGG